MEKKIEDKHVFKPSEDDKDFCEICGKNFRNTDYHLTMAEFENRSSRPPIDATQSTNHNQQP